MVSLPYDSNIPGRSCIYQSVGVSAIPLVNRQYDGYIIQEREKRHLYSLQVSSNVIICLLIFFSRHLWADN